MRRASGASRSALDQAASRSARSFFATSAWPALISSSAASTVGFVGRDQVGHLRGELAEIFSDRATAMVDEPVGSRERVRVVARGAIRAQQRDARRVVGVVRHSASRQRTASFASFGDAGFARGRLIRLADAEIAVRRGVRRERRQRALARRRARRCAAPASPRAKGACTRCSRNSLPRHRDAPLRPRCTRRVQRRPCDRRRRARPRSRRARRAAGAAVSEAFFAIASASARRFRGGVEMAAADFERRAAQRFLGFEVREASRLLLAERLFRRGEIARRERVVHGIEIELRRSDFARGRIGLLRRLELVLRELDVAEQHPRIAAARMAALA